MPNWYRDTSRWKREKKGFDGETKGWEKEEEVQAGMFLWALGKDSG